MFTRNGGQVFSSNYALYGDMSARRLREPGFTRLIIPHKPVTDSDLTYLPSTELPVIVEEMEPDSPGAKVISFNDSTDTAFYLADKFQIIFCKITTPEVSAGRVRRLGRTDRPPPG